MTILRAYCDESMLPEGSVRIAAVAGGLSSVEGWEHFEPRWAEVLNQHGVECFHMTDFENRRRVYDDWSDERRVAFITSLIDTISLTSPRVMVAACVIVLNDFEALSGPDREKVGDPLDFCSEWLVRQFGYFLTISKANGRISYFFERRPGLGRVMEAFRRAQEKVGDERRLESISAVDKKVVPLQCADFLAYEAAKAALRDAGGSSLPQRMSLLRLLEGTYVRGYLFNAATLRRVLDAGMVRPLDASDLDLFRNASK